MLDRSSTISLLDRFYSDTLGCEPEALRLGVPIVSPNSRIHEVRIAPAAPLALYAIDTGAGMVLSARPDLLPAAGRVVARTEHTDLSGPLCDLLESQMDIAGTWFRGVRLFCDKESFVDCTVGEVREVTQGDNYAAALHTKWGGPVFGQIVDGHAVAWAAVKPCSEIEWDLRVDTLAEYRGRGYAKSVVSAAVEHIVSCGKIAGWGTDRSNIASISTARAAGFRDYALDFGCVTPAS